MNREDERSRTHLASAVAALLAAGAGASVLPALAQDTTGAVEEVTVTGSRIGRSGMTTPTPVTTLSNEAMEVLAPTTLMDALDQLPQFLGNATLSDTSNFFGGGYLGYGGQSSLNLRGVGQNRTLVLLDGRRVVSSNRYSTVDISLFPQALIRRTEVVTGGASAAYGSDAVTGVTNFILDTDFTGFEARVQGGITGERDGEHVRTSVAGGFPIGDRAHFVVGGEFYRSAEIPNYEGRDWYKSWGDINYGDTNGVPNQTPQRVRYENIRARSYTFGGLIPNGPLAGTQFLADGTPAPFLDGNVLDAAALTGLQSVSAQNPHGIIRGSQVGGSGDQFDRTSMRQASLERASILAHLDFNITDTMTASVQGLFGRSEVDNQKVGYVLYDRWPITIYDDNAFLDEGLRARMQDEGIESFQLSKRVSYDDPLHNGRAPLTTDLASLTAALEGALGEKWRFNTYYQYGESNRDVDIYGFRVDRMFRGIDAVRDPETGEIVCSSTLIEPNDGCVPVNIFGVGNVSDEAMRWLHDSMWTDAKTTQQSFEFVVDGPIHEGWAGPILLATGVDWREDSIDQLSGDAIASPIPEGTGEGYVTQYDENGNPLYRGLPGAYEGSAPVIDRTSAASFAGDVSVWETFFETNVPLLRGAPGAKALDMSVAARYTDYEESGSVVSWKAGFDWQIVNDVRFRITRSRDIRAGNLSELFDTTVLRAFVDDPWNPQFDTYIARQATGGNPAVKPEEADTLTYGVVYQPSGVAGLAMSVDYYDIKIASAIANIGVDNIINYCFDDDLFCDQITWAPDGKIDTVDNTTINVGQARTRGMDVEMSYSADKFSLRLLASRLFENSITPFDSPREERVGTSSREKWHATFSANYRLGRTSFAWTTRWVSTGYRDLDWVEGIDVDTNSVPSQQVSNLRVTHNFDRQSGSTSVYGAVSNLFDRNLGDLNGLPGIYNDLGRVFTLGVRVRM